MLKKKYSITFFKEIIFILKKSPFLINSSFVIYFQKKKFLFFRYCIIFKKKIIKKIVKKNKIKRQVKSMLKLLFNKNIKFDIVIMIRKGYIKNSYKKNFEFLKKLFILLNSK